MNPKLQAWFREYDEYHRHPMNRVTHKIAIPLIVFHIVAMCGWLPLLPTSLLPVSMLPAGQASVTLGHVVIVAATAFYMSVSALYAAIMLAFSAAALWLSFAMEARLGPEVARAAVVGIAIFGWVVQLAGHAVWEKRSPAFMRNLVQALIGPIYFLALLFGHWQAPAWTPPVPAK
jgi:uncharacterized membrane protein YGL010W